MKPAELMAVSVRLPLLVAMALFGAGPLHGEGLEVFPDGPANMNSIIMENPPISADEFLELRMVTSCFGPNLRPVGNPLHPSSTINFQVQLERPAEPPFPENPFIGIEIPAKVLFPEVWRRRRPDGTGVEDTEESIMAGLRFAPLGGANAPRPEWRLGYRNIGPKKYLIVAQTNIPARTVALRPNGDVDLTRPNLRIRSWTLRQRGVRLSSRANSIHVGVDGALTAVTQDTYLCVNFDARIVRFLPQQACEALSGWHRYTIDEWAGHVVECVRSTRRGGVTSPDPSTLQFGWQTCPAGMATYPRGTFSSTDFSNYYSRPKVSADGKAIEITAYFPGSAREDVVGTGYCGSYFSPLMLFFDDQRPKFSGNSRFPLEGKPIPIFWVEPGAPGYFLALDRNGDDRISEGNELFGSMSTPNGFEALAKLDANRDGVIDAKDPLFAKLLLWRDINGDGESQPGELQGIGGMNVLAIPTRHRSDELRTFAGRAQVRQTGTFVFRDSKTGKRRDGVVWDVWFQPVPPRLASVAPSPLLPAGLPFVTSQPAACGPWPVAGPSW